MQGVNKVILVATLGQDPEVKYGASGVAWCKLSVVTSEKYKDKDGNAQEKSEWHKVAIFGKLAEIAGEYLTKGSHVYLEGSLSTRKWTDNEGIDRYTTEVMADVMQMLGGGSRGNQGDGNTGNQGGGSRGNTGNTSRGNQGNSSTQPPSRGNQGGGNKGGFGGNRGGFGGKAPF